MSGTGVPADFAIGLTILAAQSKVRELEQLQKSGTSKALERQLEGARAVVRKLKEICSEVQRGGGHGHDH